MSSMDSFSRNKGVHVGRNDDVLDTLKKSIPHWIHDTVKDPSYMGGIRYLRSCKCSVCGYASPHEVDKCPGCHSTMNELKG